MISCNMIREIRLQLGYTQEELARELRVSFSTINRWENGKTSPSKLAVMRLIELCNTKDLDGTLISELNKL